MRFTMYDAATGEIQGIGDVPTEELAMAHERDGVKVLLGVALNAETQRVNPETLRANKIAGGRPRHIALQEIAFERERRLNAGFDYRFKDKRGLHRIGASDADWSGWQEVHVQATKAMMRNRPKTDITIVTDTGPVTVTAEEWLDILDAIEAFRQPIILAAFRLTAMKTVPADITADTHWSIST
jgi:hypothetical protein